MHIYLIKAPLYRHSFMHIDVIGIIITTIENVQPCKEPVKCQTHQVNTEGKHA